MPRHQAGRRGRPRTSGRAGAPSTRGAQALVRHARRGATPPAGPWHVPGRCQADWSQPSGSLLFPGRFTRSASLARASQMVSGFLGAFSRYGVRRRLVPSASRRGILPTYHHGPQLRTGLRSAGAPFASYASGKLWTRRASTARAVGGPSTRSRVTPSLPRLRLSLFPELRMVVSLAGTIQ